MFKEINLRNHSSLHKLFYSLILHKPHPRKELLPYQIKQIQDKIKEMNKDEKN